MTRFAIVTSDGSQVNAATLAAFFGCNIVSVLKFKMMPA